MTPSANPSAFKEAVRFFRNRVPMTDPEFKALEEADYDRAFTMAGVTQLRVVETVMDALDKAIEDGTTFEDFVRDVQLALESDWAAPDAVHLDIIFRNNVQLAYSRGRYEQQTDPEVLRIRPYWRFEALLDGRETPTCHACAGTTLPAEHPWWKLHIPPLHHRCRSSVRALTRAGAAGYGITHSPTKELADAGWGGEPDEDLYEPDTAGLEPGLRHAYERKRGAK